MGVVSVDRGRSRVLWSVLIAAPACADQEPIDPFGTGAVTYTPGTGGDDTDAGDSSDDEPEPTPSGLRCTDIFEDDVTLGDAAAVPMMAEALAVTALERTSIACGDGFVQAIDAWGEPGPPATLPGRCRDLAVLAPQTVAVLTEAGTLASFDLAQTSLSPATTAPSINGAHAIATHGDRIYVATAQGVSVLDASLQTLHAWPVPGALDIAASATAVVVAAGSDGAIVLDPQTGSERGRVTTPSPARGVVVEDDRALILRGAQGLDALDLSAPAQLVASAETSGIVVDAAFAGNEILVVEGYAAVRRRFTDLRPLSREHRPDMAELDGRWLRGIAWLGGGAFVVLDDGAAMPMNARPRGKAPDLWVDVPSLSVWTSPGEPAELVYLLQNVGDEDLAVGDLRTDGPFQARIQSDTLEPAPGCDDAWLVPAEGSALLEITFDPPDDAPVHAELRLRTNDPDMPQFILPLQGNVPGPRVGDPAPDFTALDLQGNLFRLSDHAGKVVFLKLFNFGCSTCAEEFPAIESELVAQHGSADFIAVGVNTSHRTAYADALAAEAGLTLPVVLDIDSEAFRHLRIPNEVFPLHIVIARDGTIAHISNQPGLDQVTPAIDAAL